ncbi:KR domain-containing protein [Streptomyces stelliscabiei]
MRREGARHDSPRRGTAAARPGDALCVVLSSVSAVRPGLAGALGDYAAANSFLDAFAAAERAAGRPWLSIALGPVTDTGLASGSGPGPDAGHPARRPRSPP